MMSLQHLKLLQHTDFLKRKDEKKCLENCVQFSQNIVVMFLAEQIVERLKEDGVVNVLFTEEELVEELNDLPYITAVKKGQSQVKLEVQ